MARPTMAMGNVFIPMKRIAEVPGSSVIRPPSAFASEFLVQDFAELIADFEDLAFIEAWVEQVQHLFLALKAYLPDFLCAVVAACFVNDQPLAHEDQAQDEAEIQFGRLGGVVQAFEELA